MFRYLFFSVIGSDRKVPDWEAMYNTLAEDIIGYETKIAELTNDSENVCTQLSLSRAKCEKLEEALGAARSDAEIGKSEAQSMHMRLLASKNEVQKLTVVSDAAVKAEKCHQKGRERLGSKSEELLQMRKSHEKAAKALVASCNEVLILKKIIWKFDPVPQQKLFSTHITRFIFLEWKRDSELLKLGLRLL